MCDIAGGAYAGAGKDAQVISVKFSDSGEGGDMEVLQSDLIFALESVVLDIIIRGRKGRAVISMSVGK